MNIVTICPISRKDVYESHINPCLQRFKMVVVNVNDEKEPFDSVSKKFSLGTTFALNNNMIKPDDIVLYVHEDVMLLDNLVKEKLEKIFADKPDVGMVGVEGIKTLGERFPSNFDYGHYVQGNQNGVGQGNHVVNKSGIGYFTDMSAVSNYFFAIRGSLILDGVLPMVNNEVNGRDVYAIDLGMQVMLKGYQIVVADILVFHASMRYRSSIIVGVQDVYSNLVSKYVDMGVTFPVNGRVIRKASDVIHIEL